MKIRHLDMVVIQSCKCGIGVIRGKDKAENTSDLPETLQKKPSLCCFSKFKTQKCRASILKGIYIKKDQWEFLCAKT